ncbi:phage tail spike protein [Priestia megaterium]|uniref:phage tail spike protein n=1 Tax=Priestia megaterium TaxID=1404 RepID=UPI0023DC40E5|nr:phage tail spike protein [Priestia megaterium]MDF2010189.1 phage tail protein [Priestia megaterium]
MLYILNRKEQVVGVLSNKAPFSCPYLDDLHTENIQTGISSYEFSVPASHEMAEKIEGDGFVLRKDLDGKFQMFRIKNIEEDNTIDSYMKVVSTEHVAISELLVNVVRPATLNSYTLENAMKYVLSGTGYELGDVSYLESKDVVFDQYITVLEAIYSIMELFDVEIQFEYKYSNGVVTNRIVHVTEQRGTVTNKLVTVGKDLVDVKRTVNTDNLVTALIGVGKGDSGGASLTFAGLSYNPNKEAGDNFSKPTDVDWIGNEDALQEYGKNGKHIFGIFNDSIATTKVELADNTLKELKKRSKPETTYECTIRTLERLTGYEADKFRVGDTIRIKDKNMKPILVLEARIIEIKRSYTNPENDSVVLGDYKAIQISSYATIEKLKNIISQNEQKWNIQGISEDEAVNKINEKLEPVKDTVDTHTTEIKDINVKYESLEKSQTILQEKVDKTKLGGTNLLDGTGFKDTPTAWNKAIVSLVTDTYPNTVKVEQATGYNSYGFTVYGKETLKKGEEYTLSFEAKTDGTFDYMNYIYLRGDNISNTRLQSIKLETSITDDFVRYSLTFVPNEDTVNAGILIGAYDGASSPFEIRKVKLELGNTSSDWSPSYVEINAHLVSNSTAITQANNLISLKADQEEVYTKSETDTKFDEVNTDVSGLSTEIKNNKSQLDVQAKAIESKVEQSTYKADMDGVKEKVDENTSNIKQQAQQIESRVTYENLNTIDASNMLHGTAFDYENDYWNLSVASSIDTNNTYEGFNSVKLDVTGYTSKQYFSCYSEFIDVVADEQLTVSVYSYTEDLSTIDSTYSIGVGYYDSTGTRFSNKYISIIPSKNNSWERFSSTFTPPAGTVRIQLRFYLGQNGVVWFCKPMFQKGAVLTAHTLHIDEMATELSSRLKEAESSIKQQAGLIESKVESKDFNGQTIISKVSQTSSSYKIDAKNIDLSGVVSISDAKSPGKVIIHGGNIQAETMDWGVGKGGELVLGGPNNGNGRLRVLNGDGEQIADLNAGNGGFSDLYVANLDSPTVLSYGTDTINLFVSDRWLDYPNAVDPNDENDGSGWATPLATISEALRRIPKYYDGTATINLPYNGIFYEDVFVRGFLGTGSITISGGSGVRVNGTVTASSNLCSIYMKDFTVNGASGSYAVVQVAKSSYVDFSNVKVYGNNSQRGFDIREHSYSQLGNCEVYDVDYGILGRYGATAYISNCKGLGKSYGIQAQGGFIVGTGTAPSGTTGNTLANQGGDITASFSFNSGSATPPPAPETTKTFSSTSGDSWRDNFGGQWYGQNEVVQGYWGGYGVYKGLWFFGSSPSTTVTGKTIKAMRLKVTRKSAGGASGAVTVYFKPHGYTSKPSGSPSYLNASTTASFRFGESKWITIPSSFYSLFQSGSAKGIGIYIKSTSSNYYAKFSSSAQLEITYG